MSDIYPTFRYGGSPNSLANWDLSPNCSVNAVEIMPMNDGITGRPSRVVHVKAQALQRFLHQTLFTTAEYDRSEILDAQVVAVVRVEHHAASGDCQSDNNSPKLSSTPDTLQTNATKLRKQQIGIAIIEQHHRIPHIVEEAD
jgi:hypothetical protein